MSSIVFKEELADLLEVPLDLIEKSLFMGCSYLGESIPSSYEDDRFIVEYELVEVDEDELIEYANNHPNSDYDLYDNEDLVIKESGIITDKISNLKVKYHLSIHRSVNYCVEDGWSFSGSMFVEHSEVSLL